MMSVNRKYDGTRVLAYRIPVAYESGSGTAPSRLHRIIADYPGPIRGLMAFYGVGDHGGGPTGHDMNSIHDMQNQPGAPVVLFSTPSRYFKEADGLSNLPTVADDLQHVAVGCYTAESEIKKNNRWVEAALATGEKMAILGTVLTGGKYPAADFTESWKKVLKKAEVGDDIILRGYETAGRPVRATLDLGLVKRRWTGTFRPLEIKTLRVPVRGGEVREVNALEQ
jgi:alpha-mannosidase